jgi:hypothetical protein
LHFSQLLLVRCNKCIKILLEISIFCRLYVANEADENDINWVLMTKDLPK